LSKSFRITATERLTAIPDDIRRVPTRRSSTAGTAARWPIAPP